MRARNKETHLIPQNGEEGLEYHPYDSQHETSVYARALQVWCRIVQRDQHDPKDHAYNWNDGCFDNDTDKESVLRRRPGQGGSGRKTA